ncbi:MAG: hypothetical protein NT022_03085, partial [Deltaproteobacteria bacterium]|nr:hypothetical protein [Deltaproteobacteria bacterium]
MKKFFHLLLFTTVLMMVGCASMPPIEIKPITPNLNITPSNIKPLKIGVVIQDPMPYSLFYKGEGSYSRDM